VNDLGRPGIRAPSDLLSFYFERAGEALHVGRRLYYFGANNSITAASGVTISDSSTTVAFDLMPDELLLIEAMNGLVQTLDASGKLQVLSQMVLWGGGGQNPNYFMMRPVTRIFPVTMAPLTGDQLLIALDPPSIQPWSYRDIFGLTPLGKKTVTLIMRATVTNLDAAPHSFKTVLNVYARIVTGVQ
jgi:hypothetical protein